MSRPISGRAENVRDDDDDFRDMARQMFDGESLHIGSVIGSSVQPVVGKQRGIVPADRWLFSLGSQGQPTGDEEASKQANDEHGAAGGHPSTQRGIYFLSLRYSVSCTLYSFIFLTVEI
jgi:hypothetical protein